MLIRKATLSDVPVIVRMTNDGGPDGKPRETLPEILPPHYENTFKQIDADPTTSLMVAEIDGKIVGTFHLSFLWYLAGKGRPDAQVEAVHVAREYRSQGIGSEMMRWVISEAKKKDCRRVQLTTNRDRKDAHRFYERLGFTPSHHGMKLVLSTTRG